MKSIILFLAITFLMSTVALSAPDLSDADAKQMLEGILEANSYKITLGSIDLPINDFKKGKTKLSDSFYHTYKAFAEVGVITIQEDSCVQAHTERFTVVPVTPWINCSKEAINPDGTKWESAGKIIVQKTSKGEELAQKGGLPQPEGSLVIRTGVYWVEKIVKNEAWQKGEDDYRLISINYKAQWMPEWEQAMAILGESLSEERKQKILLKFDPFKDEWKIIAWDKANRDEEFKTDNVSEMLSNASRIRTP